MSAASRSPEFDQAVEVMTTILGIPGLSKGAVLFDRGLQCVGWAPSLAQAEDDGHDLGADFEAALPRFYGCDPGETRKQDCRVALAEALIRRTEDSALMLTACTENGDPLNREPEFRGRIEAAEYHLGFRERAVA